MHKIMLSNGVEFMCSETQTILEAAKISEVAIEHSCMTGRCGVCLAPVTSGETIALNSEESLSDTDSLSGKILTCSRSPVTDVCLDIEDLGEIGSVKTLTLPARVDSIQQYNEDVLGLVLRMPPNSPFAFIPGQYINLIAGNIRRSYSIANSPRLDGKLELHVKRVEKGVMSSILFSKVKENDLFRIEGPLGTFSYRDDGEENIIFLATGTGIAPIKSMLEYFSSDLRSKNIFVIWGGRYKADIYLNFSSMIENVTYLPVLSREKCKGYFYGYVQQALLSLDVDLEKSSVYSCGSELMIKDSRECLLKNGLASKRFHSDSFVSSN